MLTPIAHIFEKKNFNLFQHFQYDILIFVVNLLKSFLLKTSETSSERRTQSL